MKSIGMYSLHPNIHLALEVILFSCFQLNKYIYRLCFVNASNLDIISSEVELITHELF